MLTGALSVVYYGRPRASHDIDFVVEMHKDDVYRVIKAFQSLPLKDYMIQEDMIEEAIDKKLMFNVIYMPSFTKLDFWLLTDEVFDKSRFERKQRVTLLGHQMTITSPEDTIVQKLRWYKEAHIEKHLVDAAFVYKLQKKDLDMVYINKWLKELKLKTLFQKLDKVELEQYI